MWILDVGPVVVYTDQREREMGWLWCFPGNLECTLPLKKDEAHLLRTQLRIEMVLDLLGVTHTVVLLAQWNSSCLHELGRCRCSRCPILSLGPELEVGIGALLEPVLAVFEPDANGARQAVGVQPLVDDRHPALALADSGRSSACLLSIGRTCSHWSCWKMNP